MQTINKFISGWLVTFRQQSIIGKIIFGCSSILLFCCLCSFVLRLAAPTRESAQVTPEEKTAIANMKSTLTAAPLDTKEALNPIATNSPLPNEIIIATETPAQIPITGNIIGADCIPNTQGINASVVGVIDGDTIDVKIDNQTYRVRYIGMDTPEDTTTKEPFGAQATEQNRLLVEGKTVVLYKDVSETDKYDRLLRFVIADDVFVNFELVRLGSAEVTTYPPDVSCQENYLEAQREAQGALVGLWGLPIATSTLSSPSNEKCDPSYPKVCIPPPPPDLDCPDIPYDNFQVLPPDPHRFDRDGNGIGCES